MTDLSTVSQEDLAAELARRAAAQALATAQGVAAIYGPARAMVEGQTTFTLPALAAALKAAAASAWPNTRVAATAQFAGQQLEALASAWATDIGPQLALADAGAEPGGEA